MSQVQTDVAVIKNDITGIKDTQRQMLSKMDNFTFVKQSDFDDFKVYVEKTYATNDKVKPLITLFWSFITFLLTSVAGAVLLLVLRRS